jgi:beta-N-acetylhexosaminidase
VALPPGTREVLLVDARRGHHQAVGPTAGLFAEALADYVAVTAIPASELPGPGHRNPTSAPSVAGESVVVLVGSLAAGSPGLAAAQAARSIPGAVCINTGVAAAPEPPLPTLNCFGSSRATALAVARILCGTVAGPGAGRVRGTPGDRHAGGTG